MAKSKNKGKQQAAPSKKEQIVLDWKAYFGSGDLTDWQRLMADLGFTEEYTSKTQCRKVM